MLLSMYDNDEICHKAKAQREGQTQTWIVRDLDALGPKLPHHFAGDL